ncbi:hypothetical protein Esti_002523 [Eimeria stiedai]
MNAFVPLPSGSFLFVNALPQVELLEIILGANHSLASDYGSSYEPYGMFMDSGEPYIEPLLLDATASGTMHLVYHHCPYTDAALQGWRFKGNQFVVSQPNEAPLLFRRREKMCVARRIELRSDGEQEGSELTLTAGDQQEPRFFGYRLDNRGYTAYLVAFTRMLPSACVYLKCCKANSSLPCEIVFHDVRKPEKQSLFQQVVGASSVPLSHECPLCLHDGGEDGVPLDYFTSIEDSVLSADCPNMKPHTYADSFVFLGPGNAGSRVHKHYAIGSLSNTLQIRQFRKMTQVSVQYPNNLWLSRAGAYHEGFNPPEAERTYYIVRGAEYTTADSPTQTLQEVMLFYDSLANAHENKGTQFISDLKKRAIAETKTADAIFAEHPIANDVTYFHSSPIGSTFRFVAGGSFKLPSSKFLSPAVIKGFCVAPLFYDQWAVFLAVEEPSTSPASPRAEAVEPRQQTPTKDWSSSPLPWWHDKPAPGYSSARLGQVLYMQLPISGSRSYNERTLHVFNASTHGSFHCSAAGGASVLLLHHDVVNHVLRLEERFRDGTVVGDSQVEVRRVLHGSLLPTRTVTTLEKGPDAVLWISTLTTRRFAAEESFYYIPEQVPGRVASIQRATGFHRDGNCIGEWAPPLSSAVCTQFCVSLHAYRVKIPSRGGSGCTFEEDSELSSMCLAYPCSRGQLASVELNPSFTAKAPQEVRRQNNIPSEASMLKNADVSKQPFPQSRSMTRSENEHRFGQQESRSAVSRTLNMHSRSAEVSIWQDDMLDTSLEVPSGADGTASASLNLETALDLWHLRITFSSATIQSDAASKSVVSFEFSLSVVDDGGEEIHTWRTVVPPSPAPQSVWEALDMRLYRAKQILIKASQPFRIAETQVFGMPLPACPPGGFLGPSGCNTHLLQRLRSHESLDCQGAWSEWTVCQLRCRFMHVFQTEKVGGVPCQFFQQEPCQDGLCNTVFGVSLSKGEDCFTSPSRWSECVGCRQMRVWHTLRAASASGRACLSELFETRSCKSAEGCEISPTYFPAPPDQPGTAEDDISKEVDLLRPIGSIFLVCAVAFVIVLLALIESWRRWGTSMSAHQEVLNVQRQKDLAAAREQILKYRQMIQDYKTELEVEEQGTLTRELSQKSSQVDRFLTEHPLSSRGCNNPWAFVREGAVPTVSSSLLDSESLQEAVRVESGSSNDDEEIEA